MILNTGSRTDIPAFFGEWMENRVREGLVLVRNPYDPSRVTRYRFDPDTVDLVAFCTKDPAPFLKRLDCLDRFRQMWFVTITPYGRDAEPNVPPADTVAEAFRELSRRTGPAGMSWRYDPVFLTETYTEAFHREAFARMAGALKGYTDQVVVSFIDLYEKTKRNFPEVRPVSVPEQERLTASFADSARRHGMTLRLCCEDPSLSRFGADVSGCFSRSVAERAAGYGLNPPKAKGARPACPCLLGNDIGAYNTCPHLCRYCYANWDRETVLRNLARHDPASPYLIGGPLDGDVVSDAGQVSWRDGQLRMF